MTVTRVTELPKPHVMVTPARWHPQPRSHHPSGAMGTSNLRVVVTRGRGRPGKGQVPPRAPPAVVGELDDVVGVAGALGSHDALEERLRLLLPVHHQPPLEEPVAAVLAGDTGTPSRRQGHRGDAVMGVASVGDTAMIITEVASVGDMVMGVATRDMDVGGGIGGGHGDMVIKVAAMEAMRMWSRR